MLIRLETVQNHLLDSTNQRLSAHEANSRTLLKKTDKETKDVTTYLYHIDWYQSCWWKFGGGLICANMVLIIERKNTFLKYTNTFWKKS